MDLIADAEKALVQHWRIVALYVLCSVAAVAVYDGCLVALDGIVPPDTTPKHFWFVALTLLLDLVLAAAIAALQSTVFAMLGAQLDRPLWKYNGHADALKRFFTIWFVVNLIYLAIRRLQGYMSAQGLDHGVIALEIPRLFWICCAVPVAVCIMYGGKPVMNEIPDRLSPLFRFFPRILVPFGLGFLQYMLLELWVLNVPRAFREIPATSALINVPLVLLECLVFAVMWHLCMEHRDTAIDQDDDFDY